MGDVDQVTLPDGRRIDRYLSGPADGVPLVFHHGTPGAATPTRSIERVAHARGLRLLTISRPGYGASDRNPGRSVVDAVDDISAVLGSIGAERCLVAGWSGGGPHVLACAARLPGAAAVLVIAGVAPFGAEGLDWLAGMGEENVIEFAAAQEGEEALRPYLESIWPDLRSITADGVVSAIETVLPPVDQAVLTDEFGEDMAASFREGLRVGIDGWLDDDLAFVKPWGFDLDEIALPTMIWQGSADLMVPFVHGKWLADTLRDATAHLLPGEGHLSLGLGAIDSMLDELITAI